MPGEDDYTRKISEHNWDDLIHLWKAIESGNTPGWASGKAFEYLILRAFQLEGADIRWPYGVTIEGEEIERIDGVIYADNLACLIECKDQSTPVNFEPIAKLRNQLFRRPSSALGLVFSRSGFTDPAVILARFVAPQTILLWSGSEVLFALQNHYFRRGLVAKYRFCIEQGLANYDIRAEDIP